MGTTDINGSVQTKTKNQCKNSFSISLLWQGRPVGAFCHAESEAATLPIHTARLWRGCQMGYSANGKIGNQAGRWLHWSSAPGALGLYLNCTRQSVIHVFFHNDSYYPMFCRKRRLRRSLVLGEMLLLQLFGCRGRLSEHWMRAWMSLTTRGRVSGGAGGFPKRNDACKHIHTFFFFL